MIDTHAHLDGCADAPDALVARAREAGVERIVTVGTGLDSCRAALELADRHDGVFAALGVHPHNAADGEARRLDELRALLRHPKAVAVGETGLDNFHRYATPGQQLRLLQAHMALADELDKPIVIHSRDAVAETASALAPFAGTVVLHCFSDPALLETALERGYYVSFAGNVTFPKADALRAAAARTPADRILVETDSPFLAPQPVRGRRNEPAFVLHTLHVLAEVRGEDAGSLAETIEANAAAAFGLAAA